MILLAGVKLQFKSFGLVESVFRLNLELLCVTSVILSILSILSINFVMNPYF